MKTVEAGSNHSLAVKNNGDVFGWGGGKRTSRVSGLSGATDVSAGLGHSLAVTAPTDSTESDGDGVADEEDNCPHASNPDQEDADNDGTGDACDQDGDVDDGDGDEVNDDMDNCPNAANTDQADSDGDGKGDVCDEDRDGANNDKDNCPDASNPDQIDSDGDGKGDACDPDKDGDGVNNGTDNCPDASNPGQEDAGQDGLGDACETNLPGRMTGDGNVTTGDGKKTTHGFEKNCDAARTPNTLQINWDGNAFHLEKLTKALCGDNPNIVSDKPSANFDTYTGEGVGRLNGVDGASVKWTFTDAGEPGSKDSGRITIKDSEGQTVLDVSGTLNKGGNHQAHHEKA